MALHLDLINPLLLNILRNKQLTRNQLVILLEINQDDSEEYPGWNGLTNRELAGKSNCSMSYVSEAISKLKQLNLIEEDYKLVEASQEQFEPKRFLTLNTNTFLKGIQR